jgi:hypothetical protein
MNVKALSLSRFGVPGRGFARELSRLGVVSRLVMIATAAPDRQHRRI